jgi:hypothetical protein
MKYVTTIFIAFFIIILCSGCGAATYEYLDDSYWETQGVGSWDAGNNEWDSQSVSTWNECLIYPVGTWDIGFRPSSITVEFTGGTAGEIEVTVSDQSASIGTAFISSGESISLDFSRDQDIESIDFWCDYDSFSVTNIIFTATGVTGMKDLKGATDWK